jgi:hypothetical protein
MLGNMQYGKCKCKCGVRAGAGAAQAQAVLSAAVETRRW